MKTAPKTVVLGLLTLLLAPLALAEAPAAYGPCAACHGESGEGKAELDAPALAGQDPAYITRQLAHFRSGVRGGDPADRLGSQMAAMVATLPESETAAVAEWLAAQPTPAVTPAAGADLKNGNNQYQGKCGACHGGKAEGNPGLNAPALAWLDAEYLKRQYSNFQRGLRGSHADDTYGRQMKMMSTTLSGDKDLDDVIAFMQTLAPQP